MDRAETLQIMRRIGKCPSSLVGEDIVFLSHQRWEEHFTPVHGTALRLAQHNRVLFMEPPDSLGWISHLVRHTDHRHLYAKRAMRYAMSRLERIDESFSVYHTPPIFLPFQSESRLVVRTMNRAYKWMIHEAMGRLGMRHPIIWTFQFNTKGAVALIEPRLTVYECPEEAAAFTTRRRLKRYIEQADAALCRHADIVMVPNNHMYEARREICRDIHMLPWPVDVAHYNKALDPVLEIPEDIAAIAKPIIGIYANIDVTRFDVKLLCTIAQRRPEWQLVLIGRVLPDFDTTPFDKMPNIHLLPKQPLEDLPAFVKAFDVCMIPYAINDFTRSITPLKMAEYLASGKPVVTTALPAANMYREVLRIASDIEEFEALIDDALNEPAENVQRRLDVASQNDWNTYMWRKTEAVGKQLHGCEAALETEAVATT